MGPGADRPTGFRSLRRLLAVGALVLVGVGADVAGAQDLDPLGLDYDIHGHVNVYGTGQEASATDLVTDPDASDYPRWQAGLEPVLEGRLDLGAVTAHVQTRARLETGDGPDIFLDEAFAEFAPTDHVFLFAGRRILSYGRSYGLNPADIFRDPLEENAIFPTELARSDTTGDDMAGGDLLFDDGGALTLLVAPWFDRRDQGEDEIFPLLRYRGFAFQGQLDYSVSLMGGDRPGFGLSGSYGLGDSSLLYVDSTVRRGWEKKGVAGLDTTGRLQLANRDEETIQPYVTLGFEHTFANGLALNAEYTHDAGGYSAGEWGRISDALEAVSPPTSARQGLVLGQLNGLLDHYTLRRNYGFLRLAHSGLFGGPVSAEVNVLHGFDDMSGSASLRLTYPVGDTLTLGLRTRHQYGGANDEFTLRPGQHSVSVYTRLIF